MINIKAYFQGTMTPAQDKRQPDKTSVKREDLDTRHPHIFTHYHNFDYTSDPNPNETGIGGGLYHGPMDRFKSVKEFLENRRKKTQSRKDKVSNRLELIDGLVK